MDDSRPPDALEQLLAAATPEQRAALAALADETGRLAAALVTARRGRDIALLAVQVHQLAVAEAQATLELALAVCQGWADLARRAVTTIERSRETEQLLARLAPTLTDRVKPSRN